MSDPRTIFYMASVKPLSIFILDSSLAGLHGAPQSSLIGVAT
jgi:hypothetical protein